MSSGLPDITLVVGIDAKTIQQLEVSWPTWKKNRPEMWDWELLLFYDPSQVSRERTIELEQALAWPAGNLQFRQWPNEEVDRACYESQREMMLSGHVFIPAGWCRTRFHVKLDTDALARPGEAWPHPEWLTGQWPAIAPKWNYSKGKGWLGRLEDWGDKAMPHDAPLGCRNWPGYSEDAMRVGHSRWCSWCSIYSTEFTKMVAEMCEKTLGYGRLPIPSQDGTMWYIAERMNLPVRTESMKRFGFSNHSRIEELRRVAAEIMAA